MKQTLRKILAVLVVLSIVLSVGIIAMTGSAADEVIFFDDFNTGSLSDRSGTDGGSTGHGWSNNNSGSIVNGRYLMNAGKNNYVRYHENMTFNTSPADYTAEAKVQLDVSSATVNKDCTAVLAVRKTAAAKGYEFGLFYVQSTGELKVRLYEYGGGVVLGEPTLVSSILGTSANASAEYTLKMVVKGSSIKCFINNVLAFEATNTAHTKGTIGFRTTNIKAYFDDLKVTKYVADATSSASSEVVTSTPTTPAGPLFFDDFNSGTLTDHKNDYGWGNDVTGEIVDGRFHVKQTPSSNNRYNYLKTVTALNPYFNYANCTTNDYTVEADVQIDEYTTNSFAGLVARVTSAMNNGYEFGIALSDSVPGVRLRKVSGNTVLGGITPLSEFGINKGVTDAYHLKMTVKGSKITCYVDGVQVFDVTDSSAVKGVPAVRVAGSTGTAYFDNFKVTEPQEDQGGATSSATSSTATSSTQTSSSITSSDDLTSGGKFHFEDNFNSGNINSAWAFNTGKVTDGVYHLNVGGGGGNSNWLSSASAKNLTDFAVQGDFTILSPSNASMQPTAGISIRTQALDQSGTGGKGYEFAITYHKQENNSAGMDTGIMYVRLYERGGTAPAFSSTNLVAVKDILGEGKDSITDTYTLRVEMIGNRIKCFINDHVAFDATDTTWSSGSFAIRSTVHEAAVDNIVVDEIDTFTTGIPAVGAGGEKPTYTYPEGVYYQDDFSTEDFVNKGWNAKQTVVDGQLKMYATTNAALTNRVDMLALTDYTVEAWVTMSTDEASKTDGKLAGVVARAVSAGSGYGFGIYITPKGSYSYRLYDYKNGDELAVGAFAFALDESYRIRLVVNGNKLYGYIGDQLIVSYEDSANPVGTAGVRQLGYAAYFDNYVVRVSTEDEKNGVDVKPVVPTANKDGVYYSDNFNTKDSLFSTIWGDSNAMFENGQRVIGHNASAVMAGNPGFSMLQDYVVQADLVITTMKPLDAGIVNNIVSVVARGNYEFSIVYNESGVGYVRIFNRATLKAVTGNHTVAVEEGKAYTMTLMVEGERLRAFFNGELVFDQIDKGGLKDGAMGVRTLYTDANFDNFIVRKITAADRGNASIETGSPDTGDSILYVMVAACAMLAAAAVLLYSKRRATAR